jgi:hypothetical protein
LADSGNSSAFHANFLVSFCQIQVTINPSPRAAALILKGCGAAGLAVSGRRGGPSAAPDSPRPAAAARFLKSRFDGFDTRAYTLLLVH